MIKEQPLDRDILDAAVRASRAEHMWSDTKDVCLLCGRTALQITEHRLRCIDAPATLSETIQHSIKGDLLCFDGKRWQVARRNGRHYPVD